MFLKSFKQFFLFFVKILLFIFHEWDICQIPNIIILISICTYWGYNLLISASHFEESRLNWFRSWFQKRCTGGFVLILSHLLTGTFSWTIAQDIKFLFLNILILFHLIIILIIIILNNKSSLLCRYGKSLLIKYHSSVFVVCYRCRWFRHHLVII